VREHLLDQGSNLRGEWAGNAALRKFFDGERAPFEHIGQEAAANPRGAIPDLREDGIALYNSTHDRAFPQHRTHFHGWGHRSYLRNGCMAAHKRKSFPDTEAPGVPETKPAGRGALPHPGCPAAVGEAIAAGLTQH
jgi:hypothetical protein